MRKALILDAGCATGDFLKSAAINYQMSGYDVSPHAVQLAKKKNPDIASRIFIGIPGRRELKGVKFDAICVWDVIEHLWDPVSACKNFSTMLKPGGYIFLSTPDIGSITAHIMGKRWAFMTPPEHVGFFSRNSLFYLLESVLSFEVVYRKVLGKWTNLGFLLYKAGRVFPAFKPVAYSKALRDSRVAKLPLYVPTHDIQYIAARKPQSGGAS